MSGNALSQESEQTGSRSAPRGSDEAVAYERAPVRPNLRLVWRLSGALPIVSLLVLWVTSYWLQLGVEWQKRERFQIAVNENSPPFLRANSEGKHNVTWTVTSTSGGVAIARTRITNKAYIAAWRIGASMNRTHRQSDVRRLPTDPVDFALFSASVAARPGYGWTAGGISISHTGGGQGANMALLTHTIIALPYWALVVVAAIPTWLLIRHWVKKGAG